MHRKSYLQGLLIAIAATPITFSASIALSGQPIDIRWEERNHRAQQMRQDYLRELLRRGRVLVEANEYEAATQVYQQAARLDPENPKIFSGLGYLEARQGNYQAAASAYQQAITLAPNNAEFYYALGHTLAKLEDYAGATTAYYRATEIDPERISAYLGLGAVLLRQNDRAGALSIYQKILTIDPNHAEANAILGSLLVKQGNYSAAIAHLKKVTATSPQQASAWLSLASAYRQQGNFSLSLQTIETFLRYSPNNAGAYYQKGKLLQQQGQIAAATSAYKRAVSLDGKLVEALIALGELQLNAQDYLEAVVTYRRLGELVPNNPGVYYNLGLALKGRDRASEARQAFQRAYQLFQKVRDQEGKDRSQMQLRQL